MKQFYPGHTANKFSIIPFFMESCRQLQYISLTAGAISGTQISRIILHTVDHPTATDRGKMWGHFKWRFLRAGFLFTQETVLDIGPAPILPFYCFLLSTRVSFFSWPSVPSKPEKKDYQDKFVADLVSSLSHIHGCPKVMKFGMIPVL